MKGKAGNYPNFAADFAEGGFGRGGDVVVARRFADADFHLNGAAGVGFGFFPVGEGDLRIVLALGESHLRAVNGIALALAAQESRDHGALDLHP